MTLAASDILLLYTEGHATGRPAAGDGAAALARHSLGGNPLNPTLSTSRVASFDMSTNANLQSQFDDTLEDENEGSSGTVVNYRSFFVYNSTADETSDFNETLFRASLYTGARNINAQTQLDVAVLPKSNAAYNAIPNASKVTAQATESALPPKGDTTALAFRTLPASAAAATPLTGDGTGTVNLERHDFIGIVLRRTVTKTATPTGQTESYTLNVRGGTPTN